MNDKIIKRSINAALNFLLIIFFGIIIYSGYRIYKNKEVLSKTIKTQEETKFIINNEDLSDSSCNEEISNMKKINSDFIGWIKFDSGLINQPIVYSNIDDYYLRRDFYKKYSEYGTVFLNSSQSLNESNFTLYGHYVYANEELMFSPLTKLLNEENYEENSLFSLYLENEVRQYEVVAVIVYDINNDHWNYENPTYSINDLNEFIKFVKENSVYEINDDYNIDDKYITLQTCIKNNQNERLIVVGKEINNKKVGE